MSEKVYKLTSEQIGVIQFNKPWVLLHLSIDEEKTSFNLMFPSIERGVQQFPTIFEENVINVWKAAGAEGEAKIQRLKDFLLKQWWDPGIETMRMQMYEQYGAPEFKNKNGRDLLNEEIGFFGLVIAHVALRYNNKHFWFDGLHISVRIVDKFLSVNFWDKIKTEALAQLGTTILK